jgi:hypothetical protein
MGINGEYLMPFCHSENYFAMDTPMRSVNQPFTYTQYMDMWNNFGAKSRRRHFHLRTTGAAA